MADQAPPPATCGSGGASPVPEFFEGTEKRIEVDFCGAGDLRKVPNAAWEEVIKLSQTLPLNRKETDAFTSYLLSESSFIVYRTKLILKTCGRTVPISGVRRMMSAAAEVGLEPEWLCYSRKNFLAPGEQPKEHASPEAEIASCSAACQGIGDAYVLGPLTGEHWLLYDAQFKHVDSNTRGDFHVDIMMYDLSPAACVNFFSKAPEGCPKGAKTMTTKSGLGDVAAMMDAEIDDYCFAPCGYSCNIHAKDGSYAVVHVTPQEDCSYASFETNFGSNKDATIQEEAVGNRLSELVRKVLQVFQPGRFTMTLFTDRGAEEAIGASPWDAANGLYACKHRTSTKFELDYMVTVANYAAASAQGARGLKRAAGDREAAQRSPPPRLPRTNGTEGSKQVCAAAS